AFMVTVVIIILFVMGITSLNKAFADETVTTREARLGEQDRSLNYKAGTPGAVIEVGNPSGPITLVEPECCSMYNKQLVETVRLLTERIIKDPANAHIYVEALEVVEDAWCTGG
ncbi:MAG: hypothetical protein V3S69_05925, partial [Dehalococcoidales bacterium]